MQRLCSAGRTVQAMQVAAALNLAVPISIDLEKRQWLQSISNRRMVIVRSHKIAIVVLVVIAVGVVLQVKATRSPVDEEQNVAWTESDGVGLVEPQTPAEPQPPADDQEPEPPGEQDADTVQPTTRPEPAKVSKPEPKPKPESKPQPTEKAQQSGEAGSAGANTENPAAPAPSASESTAPAALPRMVDVGASRCIQCKMMAPILDELQREYAGKVSVEFVNLERDPSGGHPYGVRIIPTQIFFDSGGQEMYRHVGFYSKKKIVAKFQELGFIE